MDHHTVIQAHTTMAIQMVMDHHTVIRQAHITTETPATTTATQMEILVLIATITTNKQLVCTKLFNKLIVLTS
jgi:hypothetical protein